MKTPRKQRLWIGLAGSVAAAVLFALACPPFGYTLTAWLVPGILLVSVRRLPYRHAFESGLLFGVVSGGLVARWLPESLELAYGLSPLAASLAAYAGITVAVGIPCALMTLAFAYASRRVKRQDLPLVGTFFWVTTEWVRSQMLGWELIGHTQFRELWLIQIADLGGVFAVSFVVVFVSVAFAEAVSGLATRTHSLLSAGRSVALPIAAVAISASYGVGALQVYDASPSAAISNVETVEPERSALLHASFSPAALSSRQIATRPDLRFRQVSTIEQNGVRVSPLECEDVLYAGVVREVVDGGADVLINNCRVAWLAAADSVASDQHLAMAVLRTVESRRFLVRATNHNDGELITASGATLTEKPSGISMAISDRSTRYMQIGDSWLLLGFGVSLIIVGRGRRS